MSFCLICSLLCVCCCLSRAASLPEKQIENTPEWLVRIRVCVCVCLFCHITGCFKRCFSTTEPNQVLARFDLDVLKLKRKRRKSKEAFVGYLFKPQPPEQCVCSLGVARNCLRNILDFFFFFFKKEGCDSAVMETFLSGWGVRRAQSFVL